MRAARVSLLRRQEGSWWGKTFQSEPGQATLCPRPSLELF